MSPPFTLSRATSSDLPEIVDVLMEAFSPDMRVVFMGCRDRTNIPKILADYRREMEHDPSDIWIKVTDNATGKIIAASQWKIFLNQKMRDEEDRNGAIEWIEDEKDRERSRVVMKYFFEERRGAMPGPFVYLHILFTHPLYQRRGAGSLMMSWGANLMDSLSLPGYVEASPDGVELYKAVGFYQHSMFKDIPEAEGGINLKRDVSKKGMVGGKAKMSGRCAVASSEVGTGWSGWSPNA